MTEDVYSDTINGPAYECNILLSAAPHTNLRMTDTFLETIIDKIQEKNPKHASKIRKNFVGAGSFYSIKANGFYSKYVDYLARENKTLDFGIDCYLHMVDDMLEERFEFIRNGRYSNISFQEVEKKVYGNPDIMVYHMHGLVLAQFLWPDQFQRFSFFSNNLSKYASGINSYLEIGGGHGLYINEATELLPGVKRFDLVDISQSSIDLASGILASDRINYFLKDIFKFIQADHSYDFITIGEVIEHLENPLALLKKLVELIGDKGICFITAPVNSPMIDHIYLFNNESEIRELIQAAGMKILDEKVAISNNEDEAIARTHKLPVMYAAFVKKA